jgi:hypothetical protein
VLTKFHRAGILKDIIIIGSWALVFYKQYFSNIEYHPAIRTRDIDLLIANPRKLRKKVNIPEMLKEDGFICHVKGLEGYVELEHHDLIIEFLVPELGRGISKPYAIDNLSINAQALRYLNFLTEKPISVNLDNIPLKLPKPINFALHKLTIAQRRKNKDKAKKDLDSALNLLHVLDKKGDFNLIKKTYLRLPPGWKSQIIKSLKLIEEDALIQRLKD